jgi:hypothetical protein
MAKKVVVTEGAAEIRWFCRQFDKFPKEVRQELRPKIRAIGTTALASVRAKAAWSTRIPSATRLKIGLSKKNPGIAIEVNKAKAPHARPYENNDQDGFFYAPFFGDRDRWYQHPARPFLVRGARPHFERIDTEIKQVVDEAARNAGFRP